MKTRCPWALSSDEMVNYHDHEWGVPLMEETALFEFLILEGFQAGLSWEIVLKKRDAFRLAFDGFNREKVASYSDNKIESLLRDETIIRNRAKIEGAVKNARAFCDNFKEKGSFKEFLWGFTGGRTVQNNWDRLDQIPANTASSKAMSRQLKRYGFTFVGPTICYAFMQAVGLVNDHLTSCFRHVQIKRSA